MFGGTYPLKELYRPCNKDRSSRSSCRTSRTTSRTSRSTSRTSHKVFLMGLRTPNKHLKVGETVFWP